MENQFGNQPSTKEIEEMMTEEQKEKSEEREATFEAGYKEGNKKIISESMEFIELLFKKIGDGCVV